MKADYIYGIIMLLTIVSISFMGAYALAYYVGVESIEENSTGFFLMMGWTILTGAVPMVLWIRGVQLNQELNRR